MRPWPELEAPEAVRQRYQAALASFVERARADSHILAAILCGSLSHDAVWQKSDIDLILVGRDERIPVRGYNLIEDGVNLHVSLYSRSRFRKELESAQTGSFFHSYFSKSTLLYSADETIAAYYDDARLLGSADRDYQLLAAATIAGMVLTKAQKWLYVKHDAAYCFLWHLMAVRTLAEIETLLNDEVVGREVLQQAMRHNPAFFQQVYFDLIDRPKTPELLHAMLDAVEQYLLERADALYRPLFAYLNDQGGVRSATEIDAHFRGRADSVSVGCEWLAAHGLLECVPLPLRLTEKSRVTVQEAGYGLVGG